MLSAQTEMDMVECPYNKAHRMLRKRLQPHLLKCRLSYPDVELQKCPFNQTHLIPEPEFVHHVTSCSDRKLITQYKYDAAEVKEEERVKHEPIECEENWDDTEVEDYDPKKYVATANVLRRPEGHQPSQRKSFIKQERKRLGDGDSDEEEEDQKTATPPKLMRVKKEEPLSDDEADNGYGRRRRKSPSPSSTSSRHSWGDRERGPPRRSFHRGSRRSPSPPPSRGVPRDYYRDRSPVWREPDLYARRQRQSPQPRAYYNVPLPPSPPRITPSQVRARDEYTSRSNGRQSPVDEPYDLDDDPYYNGGASSSAYTSNSTTTSSSRSSHHSYSYNQNRTEPDRRSHNESREFRGNTSR